MKKISKAIAAAIILCLSISIAAVSASADFVETSKGMKYKLPSGEYVQGQTYSVNDKTYYFDKNGIMKTGFVKLKKGTYYFDKNGVMQTGLKKIDKVYYYFETDGKMCTTTVKIKNKIYSFGADGKLEEMPTGLVTLGKEVYCCKDGKILTGLQSVTTKGKTTKHYFDENGKMVYGKEVEDGTKKISINSKGEVIRVIDQASYMLKRRVELEDEIEELERKINSWKLQKQRTTDSKLIAQLDGKINVTSADKRRDERELEKILKNLRKAGYTV